MIRSLALLFCGCLAAALSVSAVPAQDEVLYYRFETGGGERVVNYWSHTGVAPAEASIEIVGSGATSSLWTDGWRGGSALRGRDRTNTWTRVDTGWDGVATTFTLGFALRARPSAVRDRYALIGGPEIECYVNAAGDFVFVNFDNGTVLRTGQNVWPLLEQGWTHFAVRVDAAQRRARLYVNGQPEPFVATRSIHYQRGARDLFIGSDRAVPLDVDEFRWVNRALPDAEVLAWATRVAPAQGEYGAGCGGIRGDGAWLRAEAGMHPSLGNGSYALRLSGFPGSPFTLAFGSDRLQFGGAPLPLDLGAIHPGWTGCNWETGAELAAISGVLDNAGHAVVSLPIPNDRLLTGGSLWLQAALLQSPVGSLMLSNGYVVTIGE